MKILHIITSLKIGGAEAALVNFLTKVTQTKNNNIEHKHEHRVAYFYDGPNKTKINKLNIKTHNIKGIVKSYDPIAYFRLKKLIKSYKPDILHTSLWSANFMGSLVAKQLNVPIMCEIHGNCRYVSSRLRNYLDQKIITIPNKIIAVSDAVHDSYKTFVIEKIKNIKHKQKTLSKLTVIKNGIDIENIRKKAHTNKLTRHKLNINDNDFVIGAVGRLEPIKSYDILIKAFKLAHDTIRQAKKDQSPYTQSQTSTQDTLKLCIIGDGSEREYLESLAKKLNLSDAIIFMGSRPDTYRFYKLFDCFALSSQTEGLSIALLEALVFGLPIITTNREIKHEVLEHNTHGLIVPINNVEKYAHALLTLYRNTILRQNMHKANLKLVQAYSLDTVLKKYQEIYHEITQNSHNLYT